MAQKQPLLNLITRARFCPVSLSLSMVTLTKPVAVTQWHNNCLIIPRSRVRVHPPLALGKKIDLQPWTIYAIQGQYYRDFTPVNYNRSKRSFDRSHYMYDSMHLNYFVTTVNCERRIFSNEMTLSITTLRIAIRKCDTQHNTTCYNSLCWLSLKLRENYYAECGQTQCRYSVSRYAECSGAVLQHWHECTLT